MYQCPDGATFDETAQQCLLKVPVADGFDQFAALPANDRTQIQKIANFFLSNDEASVTEPSLIQKLFNEVNIDFFGMKEEIRFSCFSSSDSNVLKEYFGRMVILSSNSMIHRNSIEIPCLIRN